MSTAAQLRVQLETTLAERIPRALTLKTHQQRESILCGFREIDRLQAFPRGSLVELCGPASSGRASLLQGLLANATATGEASVLLDPTDSFDPVSAAQNGVYLKNLLWVRPGPPKKHKGAQLGALDQMLMAADLLLQSGGFGLAILDFAGVPSKDARQIPLTTWFRLRRSVESTRTVLVASTQLPNAGSSASVTVQLAQATLDLFETKDKTSVSHVDGDRLIHSIESRVEVARAHHRKPPQSAHSGALFATTLQGYC
jgi:recA bacterial DNA recombination protein